MAPGRCGCLNKVALRESVQTSYWTLSGPGFTLRFMATAHARQEGRVSVTRVELSIGSLDLFRFANYRHAFPRHTHERFTVGLFGPRNGSITTGGVSHSAEPGSILAIPPDQTHSAEPLRSSGWTYRTLYPSARIMDLALADSSAHPHPAFDRPVISDSSLARRIGELHTRLESGPPSLRVEETLIEVLRSLVDRHATRRSSVAATVPAYAVVQARSYIDAHFGTPIKLSDLSAVCGISAFHLIRSFRASTGMPPHAYLTQVRANRAREMLVRGEQLSAVAYACGFADQSHLTRVFKKIFGITPGAYVDSPCL